MIGIKSKLNHDGYSNSLKGRPSSLECCFVRVGEASRPGYFSEMALHKMLDLMQSLFPEKEKLRPEMKVPLESWFSYTVDKLDRREKDRTLPV